VNSIAPRTLSDCFGLNTAVASAMVDYPIGDLIAERVRAMGSTLYKHFKHTASTSQYGRSL